MSLPFDNMLASVNQTAAAAANSVILRGVEISNRRHCFVKNYLSLTIKIINLGSFVTVARNAVFFNVNA